MQCPDCKRLRHNGPCDPVYEDEPEDARQFFEEMELAKAQELVAARDARLKEKEHGRA